MDLHARFAPKLFWSVSSCCISCCSAGIWNCDVLDDSEAKSQMSLLHGEQSKNWTRTVERC